MSLGLLNVYKQGGDSGLEGDKMGYMYISADTVNGENFHL